MSLPPWHSTESLIVRRTIYHLCMMADVIQHINDENEGSINVHGTFALAETGSALPVSITATSLREWYDQKMG